jgi:hypothetical protein
MHYTLLLATGPLATHHFNVANILAALFVIYNIWQANYHTNVTVHSI